MFYTLFKSKIKIDKKIKKNRGPKREPLCTWDYESSRSYTGFSSKLKPNQCMKTFWEYNPRLLSATIIYMPLLKCATDIL